jgi:hypothetical protein
MGMPMRRLTFALALTLALPAGAMAEDLDAQLIAALEAQGFVILEAERTWLGRLRVVAESDSLRREVVFNPGTGEILRDYVVALGSLSAEPLLPRPRADGQTDAAVATTTVEGERAVVEGAMSDDVFVPEAIPPTAGN